MDTSRETARIPERMAKQPSDKITISSRDKEALVLLMIQKIQGTSWCGILLPRQHVFLSFCWGFPWQNLVYNFFGPKNNFVFHHMLRPHILKNKNHMRPVRSISISFTTLTTTPKGCPPPKKKFPPSLRFPLSLPSLFSIVWLVGGWTTHLKKMN